VIRAAFVKDPNATVDYELDWSEWLDSDAVSTSTWSAPAALTLTGSNVTDNVTRIFVAGGSVGTDYLITNRITSSGGRIEDRSILIQVRER